MPALLVSTMPSASTRLTAAFLYSFPASVLKSSAKATGTNGRIKKVRSLICIRCFDYRDSALKCGSPVKENCQIHAHARIERLQCQASLLQNLSMIVASTAVSTVLVFELDPVLDT